MLFRSEDIDGDSFAKLKGSTIYYHAFPGQTVLQGANEVCFRTLRDCFA